MITHKLYTITELVEILRPIGTLIPDKEQRIHTLAFDSRKLRNAEASLFFALRGLRDGHQFLDEAYSQGVRNFVVSGQHMLDSERFAGANMLLVQDTLIAMQALAAFHRNLFHYPVLAITGSNGKTIVKDWLYQLLSPEFRIVRSPKSYNSQLGVALSLWQMSDAYDLAIIEAGVSQKGEMENLVRMIRPTLAVLTIVGTAHQEGFPSFDDKVREKLRLFDGVERGILPNDQFSDQLQSLMPPSPIPPSPIPPSPQVEPRIRISKIESDASNGTTEIVAEDAIGSIVIPFVDKAAIDNAITCWSVMRMFGYDQATIQERMCGLQMMEMRLQLKEGINRCTLIDDSYSNDLSSLAISLDLLSRQKQHPEKTLILSDLPEVAGEENTVYAEVRKLLEHYQVDKLITVGPVLAQGKWQFPVPLHLAFKDTGQLLEALPGLHLMDQNILIKGARKFLFERVSKRLAFQSHETRMEINMDALSHNIQQYKALLGPKAKIMAMVKAFSYGSGTFEIAGLLQFHRVDYLAVAFADEGVALRKAGIRLPIMVMNPDRNSFDAIFQYQLEPELFGFDILREWVEWLAGQGDQNRVPVHIKFDTGMHRLGFDVARAEELGQFLQVNVHLKVMSVFSHLAASGDPDQDAFTRHQIDLFEKACTVLERFVPGGFIRHLANSDAIYRFPEARYDMVRVGIGLYGLDSGSELHLKQVATLKTTITQIRELTPGEAVGYGRKGLVDRQSRIATVRIGYADGYDRRFGGGVGKMQVNGINVPTIGDICMDMCMLDVTDTPAARVGDEVLVYGNLQKLADSIGTIPYELLVKISQRVKRIYFYE